MLATPKGNIRSSSLVVPGGNTSLGSELDIVSKIKIDNCTHPGSGMRAYSKLYACRSAINLPFLGRARVKLRQGYVSLRSARLAHTNSWSEPAGALVRYTLFGESIHTDTFLIHHYLGNHRGILRLSSSSNRSNRYRVVPSSRLVQTRVRNNRRFCHERVEA